MSRRTIATSVSSGHLPDDRHHNAAVCRRAVRRLGGLYEPSRYGERVTPPERTCIGCRTKAPASDLVRVVADPPGVAVDVRHRLPGRGAWIHPSQACIDTATRRKAWTRALRVPGITVDPAELGQRVRSENAVS